MVVSDCGEIYLRRKKKLDIRCKTILTKPTKKPSPFGGVGGGTYENTHRVLLRMER